MHNFTFLDPGPRETEQTPEFERLFSLYGHWDPIAARGYARLLKHPTFPGGCAKHGEVICSTGTGACLKCTGHLRQAARAAGRANYRHHCYACAAETVHRTADEQCLECLPRRGNSDRAEARRKGLKSYPAHCPTCAADTEHSVALGICLTCCTTQGAARVRPLAANPRADARRQGSATYVGNCWLHGKVAHSVLRGKCLTCFNTLGIARPGFAAPALKSRNLRAEARHDGRTTFTNYCETCDDDLPHSVSHGKCLTCCNATGAPRKRKAGTFREPDDRWT